MESTENTLDLKSNWELEANMLTEECGVLDV